MLYIYDCIYHTAAVDILGSNKILDVNPRKDNDASSKLSYSIGACWVRHSWMFMDRMIAPINVHSISQKLFTKHDSRNTQLSIFS